MEKMFKIIAVINQVLDFLKHIFSFDWTKNHEERKDEENEA